MSATSPEVPTQQCHSHGPILVTGFGPFLSYDENPSELAVRGYAALHPTALVQVLDVDVERAPAHALTLVTEHNVAAVIAFGLGGDDGVRVERLGVNLYEHGAESRALSPHGPAAYWSTLPVLKLRDAITETGAAGGLSLSAGSYVCNALLYRLLEAGVPACFVHLPQRLDPEDGIRVVAAAVEVVTGWLTEESSEQQMRV